MDTEPLTFGLTHLICCSCGVVSHAVGMNECLDFLSLFWVQHCLIEVDVGLGHVVNNKSQQSKADGSYGACYEWNSQRGSVHVSLRSFWEGKEHRGLDCIEQCTVCILMCMMETAQCTTFKCLTSWFPKSFTHVHRQGNCLMTFTNHLSNHLSRHFCMNKTECNTVNALEEWVTVCSVIPLCTMDCIDTVTQPCC